MPRHRFGQPGGDVDQIYVFMSILHTKRLRIYVKKDIKIYVFVFLFLFRKSPNPPRSTKCQQWPSGRAAADRDRARGLNLLTADSTTNSPVLSLATDDSKPLISMSYCYVEAVERMARKSWSFHSFRRSMFD